MPEGITVSYVYDMPLPTRYAAAIQILNTCWALAEEGVRTRVYVRSLQEPAHECLSRYGLQPHHLLTIHPFYGTAAYRALPSVAVRRLRQRGREIHHVISRGEPGILLHRHLRRAGLLPNERWIYEAHRLCAGHPEESKIASTEGHLNRPLERVRQLEGAAVEAANGLVCLTPNVQQALSDLYSLPSSVLILPSGTSIPQEAPSDDKGRDLDIFYAGKLELRKGVLDLIVAMQHLPEYRLHIAGGSPAEIESLRKQAESYGVQSRINLLGSVEPGAIGGLYARARVGACPLPAMGSDVSERFTSPLKLLNMMAWGVPIVASSVSSVREILQDGLNGILIEPNDPRALAKALRFLLEDRAFALRLARAARVAAEQYSWKRRAQRLKEFLTGIS